MLPVVDVNDTTMAPSGTTKQVTVSALLAGSTPVLTLAPVKTANYAASANQSVPCNISGGSFTVTLPNAPANGTIVSVEVTAVSGAGVNTLTVACGGSDVFEVSGGVTTATLTLLHQSVLWVYGSGVWAKLASADPYLQVAQNRLGTFYLDQYAGTDDQKMTLALAAWSAAGSGRIVLSPRAHTFASQWATSYSAGVAQGLIIEGAGVAFNGAWGTPSAATAVTFTYSGAGAACMDFQHIGSIELRGIQFKSANLGVPLFQTTNATPNIHDCVFSGGGSGASCVTDAIVLGGSGAVPVVGAGDTAPYQGYQGQVYRNYFDGIRRICLFQTYANSVEVCQNTISTSCGNSAYLGGCIEFNPATSFCSGNHIWGNCAEMVHYPCFIRCTAGATLNTFGPNGLFDAGTTIAYYVFTGGTCQYNTVRDGMRTDNVPLMLDLSGTVTNEATTFHQSAYSLYPEPVAYYNNSLPPVYMGGGGGGPISMDNRGDGAQIQAFFDVPSANDSGVQLFGYSCTQVTDGTIYTGSPWVVSVTAAFAATDVYRPVNYTGAGATFTIIIRSADAATAFPWVASTAYSLGDVARPGTANSHLYQCTTAGTSGSTQPAWPTSGGTVTDGTAVWTDRGTSATAALLSSPSTATATSVTVNFGRMQAGVGMTKFDRHHIITTDGGTPLITADAGAGTGPSGITIAGSDHSFTVNITSGTSPASGQMFHPTLAQSTGAFRVVMNAGNAAAATLMAGGYWVVMSGTAVQVNFTNAPAASTAYIFSFVGMA